MKNLNYILFAGLTYISHSCGNPDNTLPSEKRSDQLEVRMNELSKEISEVSANDRSQEEGSRLTHKTIGETNTYLTKLYENINNTRPEDLPEWQEMYTTLVNPKVISDENYTLGKGQVQTNFFRLNLSILDNYKNIVTLDEKTKQNKSKNDLQDTQLKTVDEQLKTVNRNIADLNKAVDDKFAAMNKKLDDYNGRIIAVENRMKTAEIALDEFRSEFVEYRAHVDYIRNLLRKYDLATMHNDIRNLIKITDAHNERLIDLDGRVNINRADIEDNRNNLREAEVEITGLSSDAGNLKVNVEEILRRLNECCPQP